MREAFILLLLAMSHAATIPTDVTAEKDTGVWTLPALSAALSTDCDSNTISVSVQENDTGNPIHGATLFIFRTDSYYRLMNRSSTDTRGNGTLSLPGKISWLNDLYVLRIEKNGYKTKEVEFTFWNCDEVIREYSEYAQPAAQDNTHSKQYQSPPSGEISKPNPEIPAAGNNSSQISIPETSKPNPAETGNSPVGGAGICAGQAFLLLLGCCFLRY